jgi:hypothetical protein
MGPPTIWIVFAVLICVCAIGGCIMRCAQGCSEDIVAAPPPVRIIDAPGSHNVYPNHVLDVEHGYVTMDAAPSYDIPMAVVVVEPSAPTMDTYSTTTTSWPHEEITHIQPEQEAARRRDCERAGNIPTSLNPEHSTSPHPT